MEEKDMSRARRHGAGKTGEIGKDVDTYLKNARVCTRADFRAAITDVINAAPSQNDSEINRLPLHPSDIVDEVLGALLDFTDCDMVASRIIENESLTTDLHERMTRDI